MRRHPLIHTKGLHKRESTSQSCRLIPTTPQTVIGQTLIVDPVLTHWARIFIDTLALSRTHRSQRSSNDGAGVSPARSIGPVKATTR